jgi:hypothetical protein
MKTPPQTTIARRQARCAVRPVHFNVAAKRVTWCRTWDVSTAAIRWANQARPARPRRAWEREGTGPPTACATLRRCASPRPTGGVLSALPVTSSGLLRRALHLCPCVPLPHLVRPALREVPACLLLRPQLTNFLPRLPHTRVPSPLALYEAVKGGHCPVALRVTVHTRQLVKPLHPLRSAVCLRFLRCHVVRTGADSSSLPSAHAVHVLRLVARNMATPSLPPSSTASPSQPPSIESTLLALDRLVECGLNQDDIVALMKLGSAGVGRILDMLEQEGRLRVDTLLGSLEGVSETTLGRLIVPRNAVACKSTCLFGNLATWQLAKALGTPLLHPTRQHTSRAKVVEADMCLR